MKKIDLADASRPLSEYAHELEDDLIVLTEHGEPVAAIVPLRDVDAESLALSTTPIFLKLIERARQEIADGEVLSLAEMKRDLLP